MIRKSFGMQFLDKILKELKQSVMKIGASLFRYLSKINRVLKKVKAIFWVNLDFLTLVLAILHLPKNLRKQSKLVKIMASLRLNLSIKLKAQIEYLLDHKIIFN